MNKKNVNLRIRNLLSETQSGTIEEGIHRLLTSHPNVFTGEPSVNLYPALQVAMHCNPLSPGTHFIPPLAGGFSSQSTQGVAWTETWKWQVALLPLESVAYTVTFSKSPIRIIARSGTKVIFTGPDASVALMRFRVSLKLME